jgi:2',3'-cyclic-nucleotide 2'-phosphodiesterase (5'-nucleotidase family)
MRRLLVATLVVCLVTATVPAGVAGQVADTEGQTAPSAPTAETGATHATNHTNTTVTLLTYNDVQTAAAENGTFPRLVSLVDERRAAHDNPVFVAGAGDEVSPHALSPVSQWRVAVDVTNLIQPDADVLGNHEFDFGLGEVSNFTAASEYPWLASNLVNSTTGAQFGGTAEYTVVERDGVRVGFLGIVDRGATYGKTNIDFAAEGVTVEDYVNDSVATADHLTEEEDVDVVVVLAHTGIPDAREIAEADDGDIDVIAVGDDEQYYPPNETSDTIITEAEARAEYLGEINLTVSDGEVTKWNGRLLDVRNSSVEKNETAVDVIEQYRGEVSLDSTVAYSEVALDARFATNYHRESNYGNLVTDAMREASGAEVAITNAGGIRSNSVYGPGNVTGGDVFNTLPFANTLVTVELNGTELERVLASQVVTLESETGQQFGEEISQQTSGVQFEWVPHEDVPPEDRVRDLHVNGDPVRPGETYTVAVNSYIADGGSGYPLANATRVNETDTLLAELVVDYLEQRETVAPEVQGRMDRVDTDLADRMVWVDREGSTVLRYDAPEDFVGLGNESTVYLETADGERVAAQSVNFDGERVEVQFADADLADLTDDAGATDLNLYGVYESSAYEFVYFDGARLNSDVTVFAPHGEGAEQGAQNENANDGQSNASPASN